MLAQKHADLVQQGIALQTAGRFREAEACYQSVLRDDPRHPDALNLMGVLAVEANRYSVAIDYLTKAVRLAPKQAIYQNNLGNTYLLSGEAAKAQPFFRKAIQLSPHYVEAISNMGRALRALGRPGPAAEYLERALAIDPDFTRARAALAELYVETGEMERATETFREILSRDPGNVQSLSGIAFAKRFTQEDPEPALIQRRLAEADLRADHRVLLHHAAGKIFNDLGDYDSAIAHYLEGKRVSGVRFPIDLHGRTYAALKRTFSPDFFAARSAFGDPSDRPVFIIGMPRSGTTLVEQIIASHPDAYGAGELPDIRKMGQLLGFGLAEVEEYSRKVGSLRPGDVLKLAEHHLGVLSRRSRTAARVSDKNPHNYEQLGLIALLFPRARIVHCLRDPMDTCVSCFMQNFDESHAYNADLSTLGTYYLAYRDLMNHWGQALPLQTLDMQYEKLVANQEEESRRLIDFLGLDWDEACLEFFRTDRSVTTPSRWQVRQPVYATSVGRWRRYESHLGPLKAALKLTDPPPNSSHEV